MAQMSMEPPLSSSAHAPNQFFASPSVVESQPVSIQQCPPPPPDDGTPLPLSYSTLADPTALHSHGGCGSHRGQVEVVSLLSDDEESSETTKGAEKSEKRRRPSENNTGREKFAKRICPEEDGGDLIPNLPSNIDGHIHSLPMEPHNTDQPINPQNPLGDLEQSLTPPPSSPQPLLSVTDPQPDPLQPPDAVGQLPAVPVDDGPALCAEQAELVETILSGRNVFYTGSAGCGKSTVLKAFTKKLRWMGKKVHILAPTGRAALQVHGSTTWTYAGWTPMHHKRELSQLKREANAKFAWKRFNKTDVIVIDEISMVENHHLERLNEVMKEARRNPRLPHDKQPAFGGVQVIFTGDFCQLPPVRPFQHCMQCGKEMLERRSAGSKIYSCPRHGEFRDEDKWAFRSKAWAECDFVHVHLNTIHRQNDQTFIRILQKCRIGRHLTPADTDLLMNHEAMVHNGTKLFSTREEVAAVNLASFKKLKGMNHTYWCLDKFTQRKHHPHLTAKGHRKETTAQAEGPITALGEHRFEEFVQIKQGMVVVLLVNLDLSSGLCNGSQGIVCGFEGYDPELLPRPGGDYSDLKKTQIEQFIGGPGAQHKVWPKVRFHNGHVRTIFAECSIAELGDEAPYSLLMRTQIPLAPAWAMTIHKSQSLTLDRVTVNLSRAFEEGQVYVALSRATGLRGLKIEGDVSALLDGLGGNREVHLFLREKFGDMQEVSGAAEAWA